MTTPRLLDSVPDEVRRRLIAAGHRRRFARREVLFHEGDPGDTLHLIERGRVAVRITTPLGDTATLAVVGAGETVGELALLDERPVRSATVVALETTETWALHRDQFDAMRAEDPAVDRFLLDVLAAHVRRLSTQLVEALYLPADTRVARRLVALTSSYGHDDITLTQDELATLAGTTRATVNRVLGELAATGAVAVGRGRIVVLDHGALARAAT
ncbi:MAG: Crp/Fnr family transcriptional regulator [Acidimicrobiales bacterium]